MTILAGAAALLLALASAVHAQPVRYADHHPDPQPDGDHGDSHFHAFAYANGNAFGDAAAVYYVHLCHEPHQ